MCGIFGTVDHNRTVDLAVAERASHLLHHRGPDDEGYLLADWRSGCIASYGGPDSDAALRLPSLQSATAGEHDVIFGHRRLSIIDLSSAGHQPMASADGRLWITYNGE